MCSPTSVNPHSKRKYNFHRYLIVYLFSDSSLRQMRLLFGNEIRVLNANKAKNLSRRGQNIKGEEFIFGRSERYFPTQFYNECDLSSCFWYFSDEIAMKVPLVFLSFFVLRFLHANEIVNLILDFPWGKKKTVYWHIFHSKVFN